MNAGENIAEKKNAGLMFANLPRIRKHKYILFFYTLDKMGRCISFLKFKKK